MECLFSPKLFSLHFQENDFNYDFTLSCTSGRVHLSIFWSFFWSIKLTPSPSKIPLETFFLATYTSHRGGYCSFNFCLTVTFHFSGKCPFKKLAPGWRDCLSALAAPSPRFTGTTTGSFSLCHRSMMSSVAALWPRMPTFTLAVLPNSRASSGNRQSSISHGRI